MPENRCTPSPDGLFDCGVDWNLEAGASTCRFFVHDTLFWSRCGHCAVGRCLSFQAQNEASRGSDRDLLKLRLLDDFMEIVLSAINRLYWIAMIGDWEKDWRFSGPLENPHHPTDK
jgi:hypothetical protein